MNSFKQWAAERKAKRNEKLRKKGFDYAMQRLREEGPNILDILELEADCYLPNAFDEGIRQAVASINAARNVTEGFFKSGGFNFDLKEAQRIVDELSKY